jgi:hypothetical protein
MPDRQRLPISHNAYTGPSGFCAAAGSHEWKVVPSATGWIDRVMRARGYRLPYPVLLVPPQPRFFSEQRLPDVQARAATRIADVFVN